MLKPCGRIPARYRYADSGAWELSPQLIVDVDRVRVSSGSADEEPHCMTHPIMIIRMDRTKLRNLSSGLGEEVRCPAMRGVNSNHPTTKFIQTPRTPQNRTPLVPFRVTVGQILSHQKPVASTFFTHPPRWPSGLLAQPPATEERDLKVNGRMLEGENFSFRSVFRSKN